MKRTAEQIAARNAASKRYFRTLKGAAARKRSYDKDGPVRAKKHRDAVRAYLFSQKDRPCADCGNSFHPVCMDFDHRPGEVKLFQISNISEATGGIEAVKREIAKCDVVCANCHRLRTRNRGYPQVRILADDRQLALALAPTGSDD